MRVVFVNRYFYPDHSATSRILSDLAFHLASGAREVHVVTSRQRYDDASLELPGKETARGVVIHRVAGTRFGRANLVGRAFDYAGFYAGSRARVAKLAQPGDIVVAKTDPPMLGAALAGVVARRGAMLVNWLQDVFPEVAERAGIPLLRGPVGAVLRKARDRALSSTAMNVVVGERMAEHLVAHCGVPRERIRVIPNWADGELIRPVDAARNSLRREWGLEGKFVVGYSGNLGRVHEYQTLLEAMRRLKDRADICFLMIGGGSGMSALRKVVERERFANVRFKPYQEQVRLAESLGAADVHLCVLRPEFEGLVVPSKFYGIAAAGRPVIFVGDPEGELARIIARAECGATVACGDGAGLASVLLSYSADRGLLARLGANARSAFDVSFEKDIALKAWERLLTHWSN